MPDVMVTDLDMPGMGGAELIRRAKRTYPALPIVAMTAHAMIGDRERCLIAGMDSYVTKPVDATKLFIAIAEAFHKDATQNALRPHNTPLPAQGPHSIDLEH